MCADCPAGVYHGLGYYAQDRSSAEHTESGVDPRRGDLVGGQVERGSIRNPNGRISVRRLPNLLVTQSLYLGERRGPVSRRRDLVGKIAFGRGLLGIAIMVAIAYAYPGYTNSLEDVDLDGSNVPPVVVLQYGPSCS